MTGSRTSPSPPSRPSFPLRTGGGEAERPAVSGIGGLAAHTLPCGHGRGKENVADGPGPAAQGERERRERDGEASERPLLTPSPAAGLAPGGMNRARALLPPRSPSFTGGFRPLPVAGVDPRSLPGVMVNVKD